MIRRRCRQKPLNLCLPSASHLLPLSYGTQSSKPWRAVGEHVALVVLDFGAVVIRSVSDLPQNFGPSEQTTTTCHRAFMPPSVVPLAVQAVDARRRVVK